MISLGGAFNLKYTSNLIIWWVVPISTHRPGYKVERESEIQASIANANKSKIPVMYQ